MAADKAAWKPTSASDGQITFRLESWSEFFDFLEAEVFQPSIASKHNYIWRGQRRSDWSLSSSLDRLFGKLGLLAEKSADLELRSKEHLGAFRHASLGRRGLNPASLGDDEWWALGQHYGLATPLLDWTRSPFAAAYFAFEELASDSNDHTDYRVVYGLDQNAVLDRIEKEEPSSGTSSTSNKGIDFIDPMSDENQRLVSQGGLFTRSYVDLPIERWVAQAFEGKADGVLLRIEIPDKDRLLCLRTLNRMNINHLSLFPDLAGASRYTNLKLELGL